MVEVAKGAIKGVEKVIDNDGKLTDKEIQKLQEFAQRSEMKPYIISILDGMDIQKKMMQKDASNREQTALVQLYLRLKGQDIAIDGKWGGLTDAAIQKVTGKPVSNGVDRTPTTKNVAKKSTERAKEKERNLPEAERVAIGMQFFLDAGYPPAITAGIIGNLKIESALNPLAVGDRGKARGIAQWHADRENPLKRTGFATRTLMGGLQAIDYELRHTEKSAYNKLMQCTTAEDAAYAFDKYYERSSGTARKERMNHASGYYGAVIAKANSMQNVG